MCDKETKRNFFWSHIAEGIIVILLAALTLGTVTTLWKIREHIEWSSIFHANITPSFFFQDRYGLIEDLEQRDIDEEGREILHLEITKLRAELEITKLRCESHLTESEVWKENIRNQASSIKRLQETIWTFYNERLPTNLNR